MLAVALSHAQQPDEASRILTELNNRNPDDVETLILMTQLAFMNLDNDSALQYATKALQLKPENKNAAYWKAQALYAVNNPDHIDETIKLYTKIVNNPEYKQNALYRLAQIYEVRKPDKNKACQIYTKLHAMDTENKNYKASMDFNCSQ